MHCHKITTYLASWLRGVEQNSPPETQGLPRVGFLLKRKATESAFQYFFIDLHQYSCLLLGTKHKQVLEKIFCLHKK